MSLKARAEQGGDALGRGIALSVQPEQMPTDAVPMVIAPIPGAQIGIVRWGSRTHLALRGDAASALLSYSQYSLAGAPGERLINDEPR
jgi:hypothetical protein